MADEIKVDLRVDGVKDAKKSVEGLNKSVKKTGDEASKSKKSFNAFTTSLKGVGSSLKGIGDSLFSLRGAAGAFVAAFSVGKVIQAANTQEDAINSLNVALRGSGEFTKALSKDFQDFASSIQQSSTVGDEAILQQVAFAKSLGISNDQIKDLVKASVDASAATGRDFKTAFEGLVQTIGGSPGTFARVVPALRNLTKEQLKAGEGVAQVARLFEGAGRGQLNTFRGALQSTQNAFGDLLEEIGFVITRNPAVISAVGGIKSIFEDLGNVVKENRETLVDLSVNGLKFVVNGIGGVVKAIGFVIKAFKSIEIGVNVAFGSIADGVANGIKAFAFFADAITSLFKGIIDGNLIEVVKGQFEAFFSLVLDGVSGITKSFSGLFKFLGADTVAAGIESATRAIEEFNDGIKESNEKAKAFSEGNSEAIGGLAGGILDLSENVKLFGKVSKDEAMAGIDNFGEYDKVINDIADTFNGNVVTAISNVKKEQDELLDNFEKDSKTAKSSLESILDLDITGLSEKFKTALSDPFGSIKNFIPDSFFKELRKQLNDTLEVDPQEFQTSLNVAGTGLGIASSLQKGGQQFIQTAIKGAGTLLTAVVGPLGPLLGDAFGQAIQIFGQEPEKFRKQILQTFTELPRILANVFINLVNIPKIINEGIKTFIDQMPLVAESLVTALVTSLADPVIWTRVAISAAGAFVRSIPQIIQGFIDGFKKGVGNALEPIKDIGNSLKNVGGFFEEFGKKFFSAIKFSFEPLKEAIQNIFKGDSLTKVFENLGRKLFSAFTFPFKSITNILSRLFKFDGKGKGKIEKFLGVDFPFANFAQGGMIGGRARVPGDSKLNDTQLIAASPGEIIIPRTVVQKGLEGILDFSKDIVGFQSGGLVRNVSGKGLGDFFGGLVDDVTSAFNSAVSSAANFVTGSIAQVTQRIQDLAGSVAQTLPGFDDFSEATLGPLLQATGLGSAQFTDRLNQIITNVGRGDFSNAGANVLTFFEELLSIVPSSFADILGRLGVPTSLIDIFRALQDIGASVNLKDFLKSPRNAATNAVKGIAFDSSKIIGKGFEQVFNPVPLAQGGTILPGFENDTLPARLSSGETVLTDRLTNKVDRSIDDQTARLERIEILMAQMGQVLASPIQTEASVELNKREFAKILLSLNRTNARITT